MLKKLLITATLVLCAIAFQSFISKDTDYPVMLDTAGFNEEVDISILDTSSRSIPVINFSIEELIDIEYNNGWFARDTARAILGDDFDAFEKELYIAAMDMGVNMSTISLVFWLESRFDADAGNRWGYNGLGQFHRSTFQRRWGVSYNTYKNLKASEQLKYSLIYWKETLGYRNRMRGKKGLEAVDITSPEVFFMLQLYPAKIEKKAYSWGDIGWSDKAVRRNGGMRTMWHVKEKLLKHAESGDPNYKSYPGIDLIKL